MLYNKWIKFGFRNVSAFWQLRTYYFFFRWRTWEKIFRIDFRHFCLENFIENWHFSARPSVSFDYHRVIYGVIFRLVECSKHDRRPLHLGFFFLVINDKRNCPVIIILVRSFYFRTQSYNFGDELSFFGVVFNLVPRRSLMYRGSKNAIVWKLLTKKLF